MASTDVTTRALQRAAQLLGGTDALAKRLDCPEGAVRVWLSGGSMPPQIFLCAVDIVIDYDIEALKTEHPRKQA